MNYLEWLMDQCHIHKSLSRKYNKLFAFLLELNFVYVIEKDKNRAIDGLDLRNRYEFLNSTTDCSVLEMLIALAMRIDSEYTGYPGEEHPDIIFFEMLNNLGLMRFTDRIFDQSKHIVYYIISKWMNRDFEYNGEGSIFVLNDPIRDQREIEIWKQMLDYLSEKEII